MRNLLLTLEENTVGRDFIVGDLHGCYDEFMLLLEFVNFNIKKDRVIATGDLIDRGNKSVECVELLREKWFYSVMGNHEEMLIEKYQKIKEGRNEADKDKDEIVEVQKYVNNIDKIEKMPLIYKIDGANIVYVMHAELLPELIYSTINPSDTEKYQAEINKLIDANLESDILPLLDFFSKDHGALNYRDKKKLIWSRKIVSSFFDNNRAKMEKKSFDFIYGKKITQELKFFCGHNAVPFPMKIGQQYYIDTGACYGFSQKDNFTKPTNFTKMKHKYFALTMVDTKTGECYGCVTNEEKRGTLLKLNHSIYATK